VGSDWGENLGDGLAFSATILSIMMAHEMGHYLVARYHGVRASLPFFVPVPLPPLGTLGAVISMRTDQATRNQLVDIGAAGPICGFIASVPAMIIGLKLSHLQKHGAFPIPGSEGTSFLGDSILSYVFTQIIVPDMPEGYDLSAHPVLMGAWAGFLLTAIN